jgi:predicted O-methyltransferase YrrM
MTTRCIDAEELEFCLRLSATIPGWTRGKEAQELLQISYSLPAGANVVEIGSFFGSSAILLAGPRRIRGSGLVHCIDPFDCTGDSFSVPHYQRVLTEHGGGSLRDHFVSNIHAAGLDSWVRIHEGRADEVARTWTIPIDLLYLDGDQSRKGVREAYESWAQFLRSGGIIAIHNSAPENRRAEHDGHRDIVEEEINSPRYNNIRLVGSTTFATKTSIGSL